MTLEPARTLERFAPWRSGFCGPLLLVACLPVWLSACRPAGSAEQHAAEAFEAETAIFERVSSLDYGAVTRAFARLDAGTYGLTVSLAEADETGRVVASEERVLHIRPEGVEIDRILAQGEISRGFMTFAGRSDSRPDRSSGVTELWFPLEPAFAVARNREHYRYAQASDTVAAGEPCSVYTVEAVAGVPADRMPVRSARVSVARSDESILSLRIARTDEALFYHERSVAQIDLVRDSTGGLVPALRRTKILVSAPFRTLHVFEVTHEYETEAPVPAD